MTHSDAAAQRAFAGLSRAATLAWTAFALRNVVGRQRPRTVAVEVTIALLIYGARQLVLRRPSSWRAMTHAVAALSTAGLVLISNLSGGVQATGWWFLAAVPLFVTHVAGPSAGMRWCALACVATPLAALDPFRLGAELVPTTPEKLVAGVLLTALCAAFGVLARREVAAHTEALEETVRVQTELLAAISHELRTPLHGILGIAAVLRETRLSTEQRELVETVAGCGRSLQRVVDDVLDLARLDGGRVPITPEPTELLATIEDVVDLFAADAAQKGLDLVAIVEGAQHFHVLADPLRVRQILVNLVGNALKFTSSGSVLVRASGERRGTQCMLCVRVEDTGPGLTEEQLARLFQRFEQPDARLARLHGGSGLGLVLARELAVRMGGSLEAERNRARGACFELRLELPASEPADEGAAPGLQALIVEPSALHQDSARSLLRAMGANRSVVVGSVEGAVAKAAAGFRPEILLVCSAAELEPGEAVRALQQAYKGVPAVLAAAPGRTAEDFARVPGLAGTTLRPLRRSRLARLTDELAPAESAAKPRVSTSGRAALVIDDDPTNRRLVASLLGARGWRFELAASGEEGLAALAERSFALVLCDLHMPGIDGIEVVQRARAAGYPGYFVVMTASVRELERMRCLEAGFEKVLSKPFQPFALEELLALSSQQRESQSSVAAVPVALTASASQASPLVVSAKWRALATLLDAEADDAADEYVQFAGRYVAVLNDPKSSLRDAVLAAHTLASSSLTMGLEALGQAARALELDLAGCSDDERRARGRELARLYEVSVRAFALLRSQPTKPRPPSGSSRSSVALDAPAPRVTSSSGSRGSQ